jgi:hypothetical protein
MVYIGQTDRSVEIRRKEHMKHLRLGQPDKSTLAGRIMERGHCMKLNEAYRLVRREGYMHHLVKEAIEMQLHSNNFNRDGGFMLGWNCQPILKQQLATSEIAAIFELRPPTPIGSLTPTSHAIHEYIKRQMECVVISLP